MLIVGPRYAFRHLPWVAAVAIVLGACTTQGPPPVSTAPVERPPPPAEPSAAPDAPPPPSLGRAQAADTLLASAQAAAAENRHGEAVVYLERAIRLDPRNAELWIALAGEHLANGQHATATQHARKAIALAGSDRRLTRRAWMTLADILDAEGKPAEAAAIRRRHGTLRG